MGFVEELIHGAGGSAVSLIQPLMDNQVFKFYTLNYFANIFNFLCLFQVEKKNNSLASNPVPRMTLEEAERCIHDAFISAAEREIHVGDAIHFKILTKDGIQEKHILLRKD